MAQLSLSICKQLARARREKSMTQSAVAEAVGCKQSAISMLEAGQSEKLSMENVRKVAELLGVELPKEGATTPTASGGLPAQAVAKAPHRGFCPNAYCFSNVPYAINGDLFFWPVQQVVLEDGKAHCAFCGELLETKCPNCGAPLSDGACCSVCGESFVTNVLPPDVDVEAWSAQRRHDIMEWKNLTKR